MDTFDYLILPLRSTIATDFVDALSAELASLVSAESSYKDLFMGNPPFTNVALKDLAAFGPNLIDGAYLQSSRVFGTHVSGQDSAQLQFPNEQLVIFFASTVQFLRLPQLQASTPLQQSRTIMATLLYLVAEDGYHLLFWRMIWVSLQLQFSNSSFGWVERVKS